MRRTKWEMDGWLQQPASSQQLARVLGLFMDLRRFEEDYELSAERMRHGSTLGRLCRTDARAGRKLAGGEPRRSLRQEGGDSLLPLLTSPRLDECGGFALRGLAGSPWAVQERRLCQREGGR